MPHPLRNGWRGDSSGGVDDGGVIMHPLVQDDLSRITEGSWEGGSVASSYFSAISNTASTSTLNAKDRRLLAAAGASQAPAAGAEAEALRRTVKAFVELGVRGRRVEALRRDRQAQPVLFRLSRHVDAFEIVPEGGRASQRVHLGEVAGVYMGERGGGGRGGLREVHADLCSGGAARACQAARRPQVSASGR
eukprot:CAMPEP_0171291142 /NCGR_PEP_ID=MMETSP0790-20130122/71502_1 /TAXON_ID=2925 /ORGANISM="Alexandrium catenella, Strain OF101" /LENGTH=191 /DNA_ID=CAMNT_0011760861 /DNA_START=48 /DNA_END=620 /DNA_ORIENTATION=+